MDINCALASRYRRDGDGYWSEISVTEPNDTVLRLDGVAPTGTVDRETLYAISCLQQLRTTLGLQDRKEHGR